MDRLEPIQLIVDSLYKIEPNEDNLEELRQIAYAIFLLDNKVEPEFGEILEKFNIRLEDCQGADEDSDYLVIRGPYETIESKPEFRSSQVAPQRDRVYEEDYQVAGFDIPVKIMDETVPKHRKRVNRFVDDGSIVEKSDAKFDKLIVKPEYQHNRRRSESSYNKKVKCVKCDREDIIDTRMIFKGSYQAEHGYHCPKCMRNLVGRGK